MKLKENINDEILREALGEVECEGFGYLLEDGGILNGVLSPDTLLEDKEEIDKLKDAIILVQDYSDFLNEISEDYEFEDEDEDEEPGF